jgi:MFS family permease
MSAEKSIFQSSSWSSIIKDPALSKIILFQIFNGLSSGIYGILVMFYIKYLDAGLGDIYLAHYAIYYLVGNLTISILLIPGGLFADKFGRKRALVTGAALLAISGFIAPLSTAWWHLLFVSAVSSAGSALVSPAQASLVADVSKGYRREKSYSVVAFVGIGFTTAGLLTFMVYAGLYGAVSSTALYYQLMLVAAAILGLVAVVPVGLIRKPPKDLENQSDEVARPCHETIEQERLCGIPQSIMKNRVVTKILVINLIVGLGAGFVIPLFTYYWNEVFSLSQGTVTAITVLGDIGMATGGMFTPWIARHAKVLGGRVGTIVVFQSVSIICAGYLGVAPWQMNIYLAVSAYVARQDLMNAIGPLTSALLMDHSPMEKRGLVNALVSICFSVPNGVSPLVTSVIHGLVPHPYGYVYPISILVFLYTISVIIYATTRKADASMLSAQKRLMGVQ